MKYVETIFKVCEFSEEERNYIKELESRGFVASKADETIYEKTDYVKHKTVSVKFNESNITIKENANVNSEGIVLKPNEANFNLFFHVVDFYDKKPKSKKKVA